MPFTLDTNLPLQIDPKLAWASDNLRFTPVEVNRAERPDLLRVPGIGPKTADAIVNARQHRQITDLSHLRSLGVRDVAKASPFILLGGRAPSQQMALFE